MKAMICVGITLLAILICVALWYRDHKRWKEGRDLEIERLKKFS